MAGQNLGQAAGFRPFCINFTILQGDSFPGYQSPKNQGRSQEDRQEPPHDDIDFRRVAPVNLMYPAKDQNKSK
jgi:hypothetical protein